MVSEPGTDAAPRAPLNPERISRAAVELADEAGIDAVTMRNLAHRLGVEAMSLYHHVANKEALLDGVVDTIVGEVEDELRTAGPAPTAEDWRTRLRARVLTARRVMLRHPWAPGVVETRTGMSPTLLRYMDAVLGIMIEGGFSYDLAHHAMHAIGSRALGFSQELFVPSGTGPADDAPSVRALASSLPHLAAMLADVAHDDPDSTLGWCDDQTEFEFGLDALLDGLEQRRSGA